MIRETVGAYLPPIVPGATQHRHDDRYARAVDVTDLRKVQKDRAHTGLGHIVVGDGHPVVGPSVDLPTQIHRRDRTLVPDPCVEAVVDHSTSPSRRRTSFNVWWCSSLITSISSTMFLIR